MPYSDDELHKLLHDIKTHQQKKAEMVKKLKTKSFASRYHPDFEVHPEPVYLNAEDTSMRLDASLIRYKGVPYWVQVTGSNSKIRLFELKAGMQNFVHELDANDEDIDVSSVEIGYCNHETMGTIYITRAPYRKQKQGLSSVNALWASVGSSSCSSLKSLTSTQFFDKGISDAVQNKYPLVKDALEKLKKSAGEWVNVAISGNFCLSKNSKGSIDVYFEQSKIGRLEEDGTMTGSIGYVDSVLVMKLSSLGIGVN